MPIRAPAMPHNRPHSTKRCTMIWATSDQGPAPAQASATAAPPPAAGPTAPATIVAGAVGPAAGGGAAVALAWAGAGPWSLVAQIIVQRFVECGLLWGMAGARIGIAWSRQHFVELLRALDLRAL